MRLIEIGLMVAGLALLVALVNGLGGAALAANLRLVGFGIVLIVGQELLAVLANSLGWWVVFPSRSAPRFRHVIAARIAGDAVNYVTPTASLGGELVRGRLLRGRASRLDLATSIAVAKVSQTVAQAGFIVAGLVFVLATTALSRSLRVTLIVASAVVSALTAIVFVAQRRGMFSPLARLATRFDRKRRLADVGRWIRLLDAEIARVHRARGRPFLLSCACFFVGWTLGALEIWLMLWLLDVPVTVGRALTIEVLSVAIDAALFFVPAKLGTQEGGKVLIFTTLGLSPTLGLSVGVLRRIRELSWTLAGLLTIGGFSISRPAAPVPAEAQPPVPIE